MWYVRIDGWLYSQVIEQWALIYGLNISNIMNLYMIYPDPPSI